MREYLLSVLLHVVAAVVGAVFAYTFLVYSDYGVDGFLTASAIAIMIFVPLSYSISRYLLEPKKRLDESLLQLTQESLHELNIPISTIKMNVDMLKKSIQLQKDLTRVERIEKSLFRLQRLYKRLAYKIKKEIEPVEREYFSLDELVKERVEIFNSHKLSPITLNAEPTRVYMDKIGLEQVIDNLLSNAVKYSSSSEPIEVCVDRGTLVIEDHGVGMDEVELLRIYERYYQIDVAVDGKGIGLSVIKECCDKEQIEIKMESKKGVGTKVTLSWNQDL